MRSKVTELVNAAGVLQDLGSEYYQTRRDADVDC
jgi:CRISPR/Cas system-associated endonuclease Cas3-HD